VKAGRPPEGRDGLGLWRVGIGYRAAGAGPLEPRRGRGHPDRCRGSEQVRRGGREVGSQSSTRLACGLRAGLVRRSAGGGGRMAVCGSTRPIVSTAVGLSHRAVTQGPPGAARTALGVDRPSVTTAPTTDKLHELNQDPYHALRERSSIPRTGSAQRWSRCTRSRRPFWSVPVVAFPGHQHRNRCE
jgi:hypothetical protein